MKTIMIIFLSWCLISMTIAFLYAGYKYEDREIRIEQLKRQLAGMEIENEQLSLRLTDWPHRDTSEHEL